MREKITRLSRNMAHTLLVYLGTVVFSLPMLAVCLLLTLSSAFWLYGVLEQETLRYVSRRVLLLLALPGCLTTLLFNGWVIYHINRCLEDRFK